MNFKARANKVMQKYCDSGCLAATADHDFCGVNSSLKVENLYPKFCRSNSRSFLIRKIAQFLHNQEPITNLVYCKYKITIHGPGKNEF